MSSIQEVYDHNIRQLPAMERLRLATLILERLTDSPEDETDLSDAWSEQDLKDLMAYSLSHHRNIPLCGRM